MTNTSEVFQYQAHGTCCQRIFVQIKDGIVEDAQFLGGCQGNQRGIISLIRGMKINDVIHRLQGIDCGGKGTSCPDQMARALKAYLDMKA